MLPEFKKRIDTLRDILVGAVPSPAGQIEQITYALIYKFMSDIDDRAASLPGGKRTYFTGEYKKYGWHELMAPTLGAHDQLVLYREALGSLAKNPNLPELFQGIYQNAYLTFNDSRVLRLFLKEIDNFKHSSSDDIGDAYEYLLQITGAQGDVGQFRTPRHIIKFIVEAVNPAKRDSVLDPAVGTAGFLIAAYNHVKHHHDGVDDITGLPDESEERLTSDEQNKLHKSYHGFDIDPTMVRTAKVNMYLHGFKTPDIKNHDSLTSDDYWNERYDVILANPPFMSPKGGIKPHDKFGITANRAEVLFVDYITSHLRPTGRAGIVVPEGIIFQSSKAYKELRKNLVDNYLYAVVSLPAGVFQPYSGVKTSILLIDKELAKQRDEILFIKIENDGYSLGSQRREVAGGQLPEALKLINDFRNGKEINSKFAHSVLRKNIAESDGHNLSGEKYRISEIPMSQKYPMVELGNIAKFINGYGFKKNDWRPTGRPIIRIQNLTGTSNEFNYTDRVDWPAQFEVEQNDLLISWSASIGFYVWQGPKAYLNQHIFNVKADETKVLKNYLYFLKDKIIDEIKKYVHGNTMTHITRKDFEKIRISLPPVEVQREIVNELDTYQKTIDAAQTIVKLYKPVININNEWDRVPLGEIANFVRGPFGGSLKKDIFVNSGYAVYEQYSAINNDFNMIRYFIDEKKFSQMGRFELKPNDLIVSCSGTMGRVAVVPEKIKRGIINQALLKLTVDQQKVSSKYLKLILEHPEVQNKYFRDQAGSGVPNVPGVNILKQIGVPLPPIEIQHEIVAELDAEQKLIDANKKLIEIFQTKIKSRIAEIWGTDKDS